MLEAQAVNQEIGLYPKANFVAGGLRDDNAAKLNGPLVLRTRLLTSKILKNERRGVPYMYFKIRVHREF